ncbi:ectonucleotide pyrophosphatase phosphodiesterase 1 [Ophiostoma piceae UAMH 11346]|uniref:Ectonucleotide pyrophosphatase phosphodiesterase 1 n=1 Tax=Ophiostoma piceae (strain UAMH 11346) TaxID=1262450 RepID=S3BWV2_OPHP1|nr:ectonucleotide pyrophosphatase phosphodiesterase 1 [Ophiostoma piceae UAMH 11346]
MASQGEAGNLNAGLGSLSTTNNEAGRRPSLLSPVDYDADAISIRSDQDSDSEDDQLQRAARNSRELRAHDRMVFLEEDETDRLVTDARRDQDRGRRRGSNLAVVANPLKLLGIRRYSNGSSRSRSPDPAGSEGRPLQTPRSAMTDATTLRASSSSSETYRDEKESSDKRRARRQRRNEKKHRLLAQARDGEDGELMFEMEEGGIKEGSSTGESSDRDDQEDGDGLLGESRSQGQSRQGQSWRKRNGFTCGRWALLYSLISVAFVLLVLGAWKMTLVKKAQQKEQESHKAVGGIKTLVSNGTALFAPTTLIISLDGFRADFVNRGLTPRLNAFIKEGVSPLYMRPSFPSVTFPNHYTLATGLYPESHGIVGNTFWDTDLQAEFFYTDPSRSLDPKWWGGEPFWVTAEQAGARTAIHMWPGSEAHILGKEPSYVDKFNGDEKLAKKVARILEFLDKPGLETAEADDVNGGRVPDLRPQLIAAYVPNVDADGHRYGPNSTEIRSTIAAADSMLNDIFLGLEARNLTQIVNVIVVSDHGMATTDVSRLMQLDDLVDLERIQHVDGWPLVGLRPKNESQEELQSVYESILKRTADNPNLEVYLRDVNMPERYHFSQNPRIAPLWLVPKTGWNIVQRSEFDIAEAQANNLVYHPRGLHGYDHEHPLMRAIFVARGPAFPHAPNSKLQPFQNIEVYNMVCDSIGIEPKANNGTLRLPLAPVGLHDSESTIEEPADPVPAYTIESSTSVGKTTTASTTASTSVATTSTATVGVDPVKDKSTAATSTTSTTSSSSSSSSSLATSSSSTSSSVLPARPTETPSDDSEDPGDDPDQTAIDKVADAANHFWDWLTDKIGEAWDKVKGGKKTDE